MRPLRNKNCKVPKTGDRNTITQESDNYKLLAGKLPDKQSIYLCLILLRSDPKKEFVVQLNVVADQDQIPKVPVNIKAGQDVSVRLVDASNPQQFTGGLNVDRVLNKNGWNVYKNKVDPNYNDTNVNVASEW